MRNFYETFKLTVPANGELLMPAITGRPGALPFITALGRSTDTTSDFLFFVGDSLVVDIPNTFSMGFGSFMPFFFQLKEDDVTRGGFRNRTASAEDFYFTIQYYYPE